jgi:hypothetical protein
MSDRGGIVNGLLWALAGLVVSLTVWTFTVAVLIALWVHL